MTPTVTFPQSRAEAMTHALSIVAGLRQTLHAARDGKRTDAAALADIRARRDIALDAFLSAQAAEDPLPPPLRVLDSEGDVWAHDGDVYRCQTAGFTTTTFPTLALLAVAFGPLVALP